jgi:gliding motility-associated-like protein
VEVTDANNQEATKAVNLSNNFPAPTAKVTSYISPSTCATFDGTLTITASNGTPPYLYSFDNVNYQTDSTFTNLTQGLYSIFVKDANGCTNENYTNYLYPKTSCFGIGFYYSNFECDNNGTISIGTVRGGVPPFEYSLDGITYQADNNFYNVGAGVHHMYTKDATGIVSIYTVTSSPLCPINVTWTATDATCGQRDAMLNLSPAYGSAPYYYTLDGINYQTENIFTSLAAGNYTFTVKDANGITFSDNVSIKSECPVVFTSETDETCEKKNGSITATGYNGTPPYQFSIDGMRFQNNNVFNSLPAGNYIVTIKDANGYTSTDSAIINRKCLNLNISITSATCGNANGSVSIKASEGSPPYEYSLNGNPFQTDSVFNNLHAGNYSINVKDANGVQADSAINVKGGLPLKISSSTTQASCGVANGAIHIIGTGGIAPLLYSIDGTMYQQSGFFNNLAAGNYTAYIKDAGGCIAHDTLFISDTETCKLLLPNAFTPNGDGINDIFRIKYSFATKAFRLAIFNRFGEKIFETSDISNGWNGSWKGKRQPAGIYVWTVNLITVNNLEQSRAGTVTLLR